LQVRAMSGRPLIVNQAGCLTLSRGRRSKDVRRGLCCDRSVYVSDSGPQVASNPCSI
jgi:hypothetical protein